MNAAFFAGQPFADRSPIGHTKELEEATADTVRAFHDRWYRPERAVVVVSGDLDPAIFERLVAKYFGAWRGTGPAPAEPDFGAPDANQPTTKAIVEPGLPTMAMIAVLRPWKFNADTVIFNQNRLVDMVALAVINRRPRNAGAGRGQLCLGPGRPRRSGALGQCHLRPGRPRGRRLGSGAEGCPRGDRRRARLAAVPGRNRPGAGGTGHRLQDDGRYRRADAGSKLADDMVQAVDIRETTTSAAVINNVFLDARRKGMFSPPRILASTRRIFQGTATRALVSTAKPEEGAATKLAAALGADVKGVAGIRSTQAAVDFSKLPKLGPPAKVVSRKKISEFGLEQVEFSNGVRLMVYSTSSEDDRVYVRVRFGKGFNALPTDRGARPGRRNMH